jgi:hypothetical protein
MSEELLGVVRGIGDAGEERKKRRKEEGKKKK